MEASSQLHVPANVLSGKEPPVTYWVWWCMILWAGPENITLELAGNRLTFLRVSLLYIEAAILAQYQAGYKLKGGRDYGFELSSRFP